MRALSKLVMRQNNIHGAEAGKAFADMLARNTVLKELDLSSQKFGTYGDALDAAFAKEFAAGISDNGTLSSLNLARNNMQAAGVKHIAQAISQVYCSDGARFEETKLLWGSKCKHCGKPKAEHGNGPLSKLDIRNNDIELCHSKGLPR
jgi:hypothetical protein